MGAFVKIGSGLGIIVGIFGMITSCAQQKETKEIVLIADQRVLDIPIYEQGDPLIDLKDQTLLAYGPSPEIPNNTDYTKMRKTVYEKLLRAQQALPKGLKFCIYEAYRSLSLQEKLFTDRYKTEKKNHPDWDHDRLFVECTRLVSPVKNLDGSDNIPPHSTGGAVDIYLITDTGEYVDMGMRPDQWIDAEGASLALTDSPHITKQARAHRKIMGDALTAQGFINYPTEYWHWSYGDRYWAYQTKAKKAIYGAIPKNTAYS